MTSETQQRPSFLRGNLYWLATQAQGGQILNHGTKQKGTLAVVMSTFVWNQSAAMDSVSTVPRLTHSGATHHHSFTTQKIGSVFSKRPEGGTNDDGEFDCWQILRAYKNQDVGPGKFAAKSIRRIEEFVAQSLNAQLSPDLARQVLPSKVKGRRAIPRGSVVEYLDLDRTRRVAIILTNEELQQCRSVVAIVLAEDVKTAGRNPTPIFPGIGVADGLSAELVVFPASIRSLDLAFLGYGVQTEYGEAVLSLEKTNLLAELALEYLGIKRAKVPGSATIVWAP